MPLKTTVIGAWPKPAYLHIPDWFSEKGNFDEGVMKDLTGMGGGYDPRSRAKALSKDSSSFSADVSKAVAEVLTEQASLGVSVVTDGEMERGAYYLHLLSNVQGVDMEGLEEKVMRSGAYSTLVPAVRDKVSLKGDTPVCWREWKRAKDSQPQGVVVKYTIPGPMTLVDGMVNKYYADPQELHGDLITLINKEILELVAQGCKNVQIDEPVMMRYPDQALEFGLDNLALCFQGVPSDVVKTIHLCCGYPDKLDTDEYPKAPKENYRKLAPKIDSLGFDEVSIEDAEARNNLSLLSLFKNTKVILGVLTVARSRVEEVEEIAARVKEALGYISQDNLILAPDCGLGMLQEETIKQKIRNMVTVAQQF